MIGGLRSLVKHLRSSTAVFVYVLALYFILMIHQVNFVMYVERLPPPSLEPNLYQIKWRKKTNQIGLNSVETQIAHLLPLQDGVRRQGPRVEANRKELNFILILCGGGQVVGIIIFTFLVTIHVAESSFYHFVNLENNIGGKYWQGGGSGQGGKVASDVGRQIRQVFFIIFN